MSTDIDIASAVDAERGSGPATASASTSDVAAHDDGGLSKDQIECAKQPPPAFLHSPPDSNDANKSDASDSELSDLDDEPILDDPPVVPPELQYRPEPQPQDAQDAQEQEQAMEEDIGEVLPDHWSGAVPVFRPTMDQFKDFQRFMEKVDSYGMKSGIIKVIPPQEWKDAQPPLDDLVKHVRVREPIKQDIMGSNGTYRQVNILHGRSYNVPQWRQLCEQSEHQPPARRGERRANADKPKPPRRPAAPKSASDPSTPKKRGKGRPARGKGKATPADEEDERPMTPVSPKAEPQTGEEVPVDSIEKDPAEDVGDNDDTKRPAGRMGGSRQAKAKTQSVSARRKYSRREGSAMIDEAAFKDFDYRMDISDYTPERCEELERAYWKTLTYAAPLYGADMMGTLFDDRTDIWNLNKLPNLLDVLGTKVPGVNTAYLYLGMWKATFAWHLEDVDLYSINYLHFGAPKQWYSISQADARRFEAAMKNVWPADAKACDQFLRHKGFLISPHHLLSHYGIKVNKVVSYPGEFVVTYPYGYHSGYNLGYNCAEAVNFALDSWLPMGKIAKKCECAQAQDSVWINVYEIERKLRGEETEYEETEDEDEDDEDMSGLPTPPASHGVKFKDGSRKRKRGPGGKDKIKVKKVKLRLKTRAEPPCCLCPHDISGLELLPTEDGRKAHRLCALYMPETYIDSVDDSEVVCNVNGIHKDRLDLKCLLCRSKRGACFQCSHNKCARAYHATCAAAAGCFVEEQDVPVFGEDGTEFKEQAFDFSCRFHRTRRDKKHNADVLEADGRVRAAATSLQKGEIRQFQYLKGEIFAGIVVENREEDETVLINVLPTSDTIEVQWKWLLLPDPADYRLPKASAKAIPLPASRKAKDKLNTKRLQEDKPRKDDPFVEGYTWAEFLVEPVTNASQAKLDLSKPDQIWYYLGKTSTDAKAQYTEDPTKPRYNAKGNYLDTLPKPAKPPKPPKPAAAVKPVAKGQQYGVTGSFPYVPNPASAQAVAVRFDKPYVYKPKGPIAPQQQGPATHTAQRFALGQTMQSPSPSTYFNQNHYAAGRAYQNSGMYSVQRFEPMGSSASQTGSAAPQKHQYAGVPNAPQPAVTPAQTWQPHSPASYQKPSPVQQSRPNWQVHSSVYQKYPFFQVNHNRDAVKYRTPYSPWGGFTNGYEGDLRAHLMSHQNDLLRRPTFSSMSPGLNGSPLAVPRSHHTQHFARPLEPSRPLPSPQTPNPNGHSNGQNGFNSLQPNVQQQPSAGPYNGSVQNHQPMTHQPTQVPKPKPAPTPKSYKVGMPAAIGPVLQSMKY
ncbi:jumonji family transcription factor [Purpureocillium lilacinum]|uniref:[histone H3]-trimethyl-L-lysine(9) demethylase n=1 Tax=Purpureocillium lilacinum TaxID=33203 RepID=A0A179HEQ0_PURLI|nr:jumonji family transcription factor [Purpureocillium lilacinum]OAQ88846.1 jumonji family transcription factor [Purpureocillium lilacinum]